MEPEAVDRCERVHHGSDPAIRLDFSANCNPRIPDGISDVYATALDRSRRYPADYRAFRTETAATVDCDPEQVIPTAGGMAAIRLAIEISTTAGSTVLLAQPTFAEYAREISLQGARAESVPESTLLQTDPDPYDLVIVCTPNNPTGWLPDRAALQSFVQRCRDRETTVLLDEAFLGFTDQRSLAGTPGVVVARSLTKLFGLPGLRMGSVIASGQLRDRLETAVTEWSMSVPAAAVGAQCLTDRAFVAETKRRVRRERSRLRAALEDSFGVRPSSAPYLLLDVGTADRVDDLIAELRAEEIAIRDARTFDGLDQHVRIAVRTASENDELLDALTDGDHSE